LSTLQYTHEEYEQAKSAIENRIKLARNEGIKVDLPNETILFPIAKDRLIPYTETLIYQTIFGTQISNQFLAQTVGLKELIADTQQKAASGSLYGLYGHKLYSRAAHKAFNLLLQHGGAVFMKYYLQVVDSLLSDAHLIHGRDFGYVANIHDAINIETDIFTSRTICPLLIRAFKISSDDLGFKYQVHGKPSVGRTQWDVH
jgi:DNA polymerase-1